MERYQPCPNCASDKAELISFTWWGGIVGPKMFTHVKCTKCGTTFNGKTGKSNQTAIAIYVAVSTVFAIVVFTALSPSRQQNNPSTSAVPSPDVDSPLETLRERVEIARSFVDV
jgi:predicted nucleic-acid-binding Zn-ribbon protein